MIDQKSWELLNGQFDEAIKRNIKSLSQDKLIPMFREGMVAGIIQGWYLVALGAHSAGLVEFEAINNQLKEYQEMLRVKVKELEVAAYESN